MPGFGWRSKKYLRRMLASISVLLAIFIVVLSVTIYYSSARTVSDMQQKANAKLLSSIDYNIQYMQEMMRNLSLALATDNKMTAMMYGDVDRNKLLLLHGYQKMYSVIRSTNFLHSITVYNSRLDDFFSTSEKFEASPGPYKRAFRELMKQDGKPLVPEQLLPASLENDGGRIDAFSYYWFESLQGYKTGLPIIAYNIKADWIFNNLHSVNDNRGGARNAGFVYILDPDGTVYSSDRQMLAEGDELSRQVGLHLNDAQGRSGSFTGTFRGEKSLITFMNTGIQDWSVVIVQPHRIVMQELLALRATSIALTGLFLLFAIVLSLLVSLRLYRPVHRMIDHVRSGAADTTAEVFPVRDELDYVASVYSQVTEKLRLVRKDEASKMTIAKNYYLRKLITDSALFTMQEFKECEEHRFFGVSPERQLVVALLRIDRYREIAEGRSAAERKLLRFAILNIAAEIVNQPFIGEVADMREDHFVLLLQQPNGAPPAERAVVEAIARIQSVVEGYYHLSLSAAVSAPLASCSHISGAYEELKQQIRYKLVFGHRSIITPALAGSLPRADAWLPDTLEKRLAESLRSGHAAAAEQTLADIHEALCGLHCDSITHALLNLVFKIRQVLKEINSNRIQAISLDLDKLNRQILELETLDDIFRELRAVCADMCARLKRPEADRNDMLIAAIREIVEEQYPDIGLNLQGIASMLKLSPSYAGRLFKQHTGVSVAEYINQVRMRVALRLLESEDASINEIMTRVGYANQSYFFKLFKKSFGTTPREYRLKTSRSTMLEGSRRSPIDW